MKTVFLHPDNRCDCNCAESCPLGKVGMESRCTLEELEAAGVQIGLALVAKEADPQPGDPILGRLAIAAPATDAGHFMFMPAGPQVIRAAKGAPGGSRKDITAHVLIERGAEVALQRQLEAINARGGDKAYFDFNHEDRDASFWPRTFTWQDSPAPGVYVTGDWSEAGRAAINGKTYRSFSPVFHVDDDQKKPCRIICHEGARPNMGGLVNNPAFKNNLPLWAKHAGAPSTSNQTKNTMHKTKAELEALIQQINNDLVELQAKDQSVAENVEALAAKSNELTVAQAQLEAVIAKEKTAAAEAALMARNAVDAATAVGEAVRRGAIGARDEELKRFWLSEITNDPSKAAVLAKMKGSVTLTGLQPIAAAQGARITPSITITRESGDAVMGRMGNLCHDQLKPNCPYTERPKLAREFAAIYAKEILPRLREGDDIPLASLPSIMGLNTLGTLAQTLVAIRSLELLTLTFPILSRISTDFSDSIVSYGDTLNTRVVGIPSVQTFNTTTGWPTQSDVTTVDVAMTYNQWKGVPVRFLSQELAGTTRRLFDEIAPAQAYALGKDVVDYIYALITSAYTNTATAAGLGTFGRSTVIDIGGILDDAGVPDMGRFLLLARTYYSALKKDNSVVLLAANQKAEIIEKGVLPNVEDFDVIKAVNLPATAISGKTLKGFGGSKSSLVVATRLTADYTRVFPGAAHGNLQVVTTPNGISANLVQFVDHNGAYAAQRMDLIYAASRGQVAAGALLTDA